MSIRSIDIEVVRIQDSGFRITNKKNSRTQEIRESRMSGRRDFGFELEDGKGKRV
jgi:hypothetical protein